MILKRTLAGIPAAFAVTTGLALLMAGMIKVEYQALIEKPDPLSFIINEEPPDLIVRPKTERPELRKVEVPPPPPTIATDPSELPHIKLVEIDTKPPDLPKPEVKWTKATFTVSDANARPLVRIPPAMPAKFAAGNNSGRCVVQFDVSAKGSPFKVQIISCSANSLREATRKAVLNWRYQPKIVNGQAVMMNGVRDEIVFELIDENGRRLPEI